MVRCVKGIINLSKFKPKVAPNDAERKSEEAIRQSAQIDASRVPIEASDSVVTLATTARAWAQQDEADRVVWAPPASRRSTTSSSQASSSAAGVELSSLPQAPSISFQICAYIAIVIVEKGSRYAQD